MANKDDPFGDIIAEEQAAKASPAMPPPGVNPYGPGTEEADWFNRQPRPQQPPPRAAYGYSDLGVPVGQDDPFADLPKAGFTPQQPPPREEYRGSMLPFTRDTNGAVRFTPFTAGPVGSLIEGAELPGRVAGGQVKVNPDDPNFMGQVLNMAGGYGVRPNPMVRSGDLPVPGVKMAPKVPSAAVTQSGPELYKRGSDQHAAFRELPIEYNPEHFGVLATQMEQRLVEHGVHPEDAPGLYRTINRLREFTPPADDPTATISVRPSNLMSIRDNITKKFEQMPEDKHGVGQVLGLFDQFMEQPPAGAVRAGPAEFGAQLYKEGRANMAAGHRDAGLAQVQREAGMRADAANSGLNDDNSLRSKITSFILNQKKVKGFTPDEVAMLEAIPEGSTKTNLQRRLGNTLGGGGGIGGHAVGWSAGALASYLGLPPVIATPLGFAAPLVGEALKRAAGRSTNAAIDEARTVLRQRSPVFQQTPFKDMVPEPGIALSTRDRIAREVARVGTQPQGAVIPTDEQGNQLPPAYYD